MPAGQDKLAGHQVGRDRGGFIGPPGAPDRSHVVWREELGVRRRRPSGKPSNPTALIRSLAGLQSSHLARDCALLDSGRTGDEFDPAEPQRPHIGSYGQPALALVQMRQQRLELRRLDGFDPPPVSSAHYNDPWSWKATTWFLGKL